MKNSINKENWIEEVMNSTSGMERAATPPDLYKNVMTRLAGKSMPSTPAKHWIAAAVLLLALNIGSILYSIGQNKKTANTTISSLLFTEMQSGSTYNY